MSVGNSTGTQYLRCSKRADNKSCEGCGKLKTPFFFPMPIVKLKHWIVDPMKNTVFVYSFENDDMRQATIGIYSGDLKIRIETE